MTLLAPWLIVAGLAAAAAFVVAHLRGRRDRRIVAFAAVRFLPPPGEPRTRRKRLRDPLLLAARIALALLLAVAAARPQVAADDRLAVYGTPHDAVLVLDDSASTAAVVDGRSVRSEVAARAREILAALPAGSRAGLAFVDPSRKAVSPTDDLRYVRSRIDAWEQEPPRPVARPLADAVAAARRLAPPDGSRPFVLYPVGDRTATGVPGLAPHDPTAPVLPAAVGDPEAEVRQVWIASVDWAPDPTLERGAVTLRIALRRIGPWGDTPIVVRLVVGGVEIGRTEPVFEDGAAEVTFTHVLEDPAAAIAATVEVTPDDALPADNRSTVWLQADRHVDVLVVDGAPSELRPHDEVFYLVTALSVVEGEPPLAVHVKTPPSFTQSLLDDPHALDGVDVLVLANVPAPDAAAVAAIVRAVRAGMGLWISAGDHVDPAAYNAAFGDLLPLPLRDAKVAGTLPGRERAKAAHLSPPNLDDPLLAGLTEDPGLSHASAHRLLLLEPSPGAETDTALSFESGAPALLSARRGRGRVALLTTTLDRDWGDLPLRPGFVALCETVIRNLASGRGGGAAGNRIPPGTPRALVGEGPWTVELPDGTERLVAAASGGAATFADTWRLGPYAVRAADGRIVDRFSVVFDPSESDLGPVPVPEEHGAAGANVAEVALWSPLARWFVEIAAWVLLFEALLRLVPGLVARRRRP